MDFDALIASRLQFAFTIAFHIIFPSFTIGLASFLAVLEGLWLFTKKEAFKTLYLFWIKIFALSFGMGVVTGVVMSYEIGTNWSVFSVVASPVIGPLLAFEVLTAFFLEASFLGVMLFGWKKVGPGLHFTATDPGGHRHHDLGLLDHLGQQLDAAPDRLHDARRRDPARRRLVAGDLLADLPRAAGAHAAGRLPDHVPGGRRRLGLAAAEGQGRPAFAHRASHGHRDVRRGRPPAAGRRRHVRQDRRRGAAGQARRHRGFWKTRAEQPFNIAAWPDRATAEQPLGDRRPQGRQPDHPRLDLGQGDGPRRLRR
jgi:hypothetical protein